MEEEWRVFLSQNAPELYEEMLSSVKHAAKWRDDEITRLRAELDAANETIKKLRKEIVVLKTRIEAPL